MRYSEGFRLPGAADALVREIHRRVEQLTQAGWGRVQIMEVCGTHTMSVGRYGLRRRWPSNLRLVSGPGCPVCVTDPGYLDTALELGRRGATLTTFGDLLHVPASDGQTLARFRSAGGDVRVCYSPLDALDHARREPDRPVVFLAIGFETTIAPVLRALELAREGGVKNFTALTAFKRVVPAMDAVLQTPEMKLHGFLCPPHVSTVIGADAYRGIVERYGTPCVVAGFEPLDILWGVSTLLELIQGRSARVVNCYARVVRAAGNPRAQRLIEEWLEPCAAVWRGFGELPDSAFRLRSEHAEFDAETQFGIQVQPGRVSRGCRCGEVVAGRLDPPECPLFGRSCTPAQPIGPCMVSAEGSCAAWYKYERMGAASHV